MKSTLLALISLLFVSCLSDNEASKPVDYTVQNEKEIVDYIAKNKLTATKTDSGLYYVVNEAGTGAQPTASSNVTVAYKGYFTNGNIFDQSDASGISFGLNQVIKGWTEGIPFFKEGGNGVLLIPSHLGYGSNGSGPIPAGSVLVFNVKLIKVN
ncbi:peptidylprolyl isomerase [Flavobacterium sp. GSP27]|uniref:FKBP-type peptidyl-prolyl cis-trans isomerase n=1 Tax=Flavobacterium sp. GSP27 TaxID=2497489 RepID=UPI000F81AC76|nr:FKBP-type peptidyl-prolyl cis-trans isomerase [Flavobacterium sp. GSP27]RTY89259.1 peptidylprolyl isomerase [Flavobacterium sp. GSN2]RTZ10214.1 peptidylprolyl isomerase [Flavobacterium sp. GSP27]